MAAYPPARVLGLKNNANGPPNRSGTGRRDTRDFTGSGDPNDPRNAASNLAAKTFDPGDLGTHGIRTFGKAGSGATGVQQNTGAFAPVIQGIRQFGNEGSGATGVQRDLTSETSGATGVQQNTGAFAPDSPPKPASDVNVDDFNVAADKVSRLSQDNKDQAVKILQDQGQAAFMDFVNGLSTDKPAELGGDDFNKFFKASDDVNNLSPEDQAEAQRILQEQGVGEFARFVAGKSVAGGAGFDEGTLSSARSSMKGFSEGGFDRFFRIADLEGIINDPNSTDAELSIIHI